MSNQTPVYGCSGCATSLGRLGCAIHGYTRIYESPPPVVYPSTTPTMVNLDILVGELREERDRLKAQVQHLQKALASTRAEVNRRHPNADLLTKVEAEKYLADGTLPDNFSARLVNFVESYECSNCDDVKDMNVVMRTWEDDPSWCPHCCGPEYDPTNG